MNEIQLSYVTKYLKKHFPNHIMTAEFRKEFTRSLSVFIFYIQSFQTKKAYTKDDIITTLYRCGLGDIGDQMNSWVIKDLKEAKTQKVVDGNNDNQNIVMENDVIEDEEMGNMEGVEQVIEEQEGEDGEIEEE